MDGDVPEWMKWAAAIAAPIVAWFGKDFFVWWTNRKREEITRDDKIVERRSTRIDNEIERALKLKDELIAELKARASERNVEMSELIKEVRLCRHEKEEFAKQTGLQAVTIAETKAEVTRAKADLADAEVDMAHLRQDLATARARISQLESSQAGVREAVGKLDPSIVPP
ncbi:MAG TPA: hypothetical protein VFZ38_10720 [Vicinamibacterales bacterium]